MTNPDLRRLSFLACVLIVLLRISIGWQFLHEGVWKLGTLSTASPWTAEGYLRNAQGPFRDAFRNLAGDPNDFNWLDADRVIARWDDWHRRFVAHYKLDASQTAWLDQILNGSKEFTAGLERLPAGVNLSRFSNSVRFDEKRKLLVVDGVQHLLPADRDRILALAPISDEPSADNSEQKQMVRAFHKAVNDAYARSSRIANSRQRDGISFKERLRASLIADPDLIGPSYSDGKGKVVETRIGELQLYTSRLKRWQENHEKAQQDFEFEHLEKQWGEIQQLRARLVGPLKALEAELKTEAEKLLTVEQLALGPVQERLTQMNRLDRATMWSLTIIGALMIVGLFSRLSAFAGAGLVLMFYLAMPPWPGVPEAPGPEHSLIVNKNLIEVVALLALAAIPSGRWFGLDAMFRRFVLRKPTD